MNCLISTVQATLGYLKDNPITIKGKNFVVPVVIPNIGREQDIVFHTIKFKSIRTAGRLGDDYLPWTLAAGAVTTIAPEQIEDYHKGSPFSEYLADFLIDGTGFVVSEIVGDVVGKGSAAIVGPLSPIVEIGIDWYTGSLYDNIMDNKRKGLQRFLEGTQITPPVLPAPAIPAPTPPPRKNPPTETPTPFSSWKMRLLDV